MFFCFRISDRIYFSNFSVFRINGQKFLVPGKLLMTLCRGELSPLMAYCNFSTTTGTKFPVFKSGISNLSDINHSYKNQILRLYCPSISCWIICSNSIFETCSNNFFKTSRFTPSYLSAKMSCLYKFSSGKYLASNTCQYSVLARLFL